MRYLRLFGRFVEFAVGRSLEFRFDFFFRVVMDLIFYAVNIAFFKILFLHTPSLGGWGDDQMMVFVAGFCLVDAMSMTLFSNNLYWLPLLVNRGDLDYYLVRPVSSLFMLSLRDFAVNSFINFIFALGIFAWAIERYPGGFGVSRALLYFAYLCIGLAIQYLLRMLFLIPVFWTHSTRGLDRTFFHLSRVTERPDGIFRGWPRWVFTWILPFCLMASFPARLVLDGFHWRFFGQMLMAVMALSIALLLAWRKALRAYSSASS